MLWMRYHHTILSDHPNPVPMRVALFGFSDIRNFAQFQDTTMGVGHVLFDQFWINSRRVLWESVDNMKLPDHNDRRKEETPGGFIWQFKYTVRPGKQDEWNRFLEGQHPAIEAALEENSQFVEGNSYHATKFRHTHGNMFAWEFLNMAGLSATVYESSAMQEFFDEAPAYLESWNTLLLGPPSSQESPFFWQAKGNAPKDADAKEAEDL
eukprot:NODE_3110_length_815_cov_175.336815_g2588_i0.p1 GENE.NODE_3110_length_815_cov_175.336815_g2588_i0~~NODE_3110_length_815_cov_175.336815_g2588_i0.p1  ORF type:complete len:209 (-),score=40.38 NODE_3110_length_815_cov_175.336815_g2588_i0:64-690(-)